MTWPSEWTDAAKSVDIDAIRPIADDPKLEAPKGGRVQVRLGVRAI